MCPCGRRPERLSTLRGRPFSKQARDFGMVHSTLHSVHSSSIFISSLQYTGVTIMAIIKPLLWSPHQASHINDASLLKFSLRSTTHRSLSYTYYCNEIMFSIYATSLSKASTRHIARQAGAVQFARRGMVTPKLEEAARDANYAWKKSCYSGMDYTIGDESTVFEAVNKLAAYDVGCLVTKDANGKNLK